MKGLENKDKEVTDIIGNYNKDTPCKLIFVARSKDIDVYQSNVFFSIFFFLISSFLSLSRKFPKFLPIMKMIFLFFKSIHPLRHFGRDVLQVASTFGKLYKIFFYFTLLFDNFFASQSNQTSETIIETEEKKTFKTPKLNKMVSFVENVIDQISESEIKIEYNKTLGKSLFGVVYKGIWRNDSVAVKVMKLENFSEEEIKQFKSDTQKLSKIKHKNLINIYCYKIENKVLTMVQERMKYLSLKDSLKTEKPRFVVRMKYAKEVGQCIAWCHQSDPPLYNLDLKTSNILVGRDQKIKVDGFVGLSKIKNVGKKNSKIFYKSYRNCAPEILLDKPYNEKADIWSFGLLLWELTTLEQPFSDLISYDALVEKICKRREIVKFNDSFEPLLFKIIAQCLSFEPEKRPSMKDILRQIPQIQLEYYIKDPSAISFWNEKFGNEHGGFSEIVQFDLFIEELFNFLSLPEPDPTSNENVIASFVPQRCRELHQIRRNHSKIWAFGEERKNFVQNCQSHQTQRFSWRNFKDQIQIFACQLL